MSKNSKTRIKSRPAYHSEKQTGKGKAYPKSMALISVIAILLGIMITAHDYLDRHSKAAAAARTELDTSLSELSASIEEYADALPAENETKIAGQLRSAAGDLTSDDITKQSEAYLSVSACLKDTGGSEDISGDDAGTLNKASDSAGKAAEAYNKEARLLNETLEKFPYNLIAGLSGYTAYPLFDMN